MRGQLPRVRRDSAVAKGDAQIEALYKNNFDYHHIGPRWIRGGVSMDTDPLVMTHGSVNGLPCAASDFASANRNMPLPLLSVMA